MRIIACHRVLLVVTCGLWIGCNNDDSTSPTESPSTTETKPSAAPVVVPLLEDWEKPAVAFFLTGEQHGYLEPCGCSETQSGGVARRHDLLKQMVARDWAVTGLDLGGTLKRSRLQSKIKFDAVLRALREMNYAGMNLGPEELALGAEEMLTRFDPNGKTEENLPFLSANVTLFGSPELGVPQRYRVYEVNGIKIGVTSIVGPKLTVDNPYLEGDITVASPVESLAPVVESLLAEQPDLMILLSHAETEETRALIQKFPQFHLVVSAGGYEDPEFAPKYEGETMLLHVGQKGKYTGVVGYYPDAEKKLKFELVDLDRHRFENTPEMVDVMRYYQGRLKDEDVVNRDPSITHPSGYQFVGASDCAKCHTKAHSKWSESRHAHAFEILLKGGKEYEGQWVSRIHDPECLVCHTTGWSQTHYSRFDSGYLSQEATSHLLNQQCENCHGPGSHHGELEAKYKTDRKSVEFEQLLQARREVQLTEVKAVKTVCIRCHDGDNSPKFEFEKYWEKVKHPGRD
ncbi:MAG: multiheme c-type cytochrome [Planctomycetaceae bacterium]|jgi:hypothetical protein|nr:multiheme c-type cytochrome [bacterium]MDG2391121.1 multiheme c-type cytochrome [Planctomycetaceae bacterium]